MNSASAFFPECYYNGVKKSEFLAICFYLTVVSRNIMDERA